MTAPGRPTAHERGPETNDPHRLRWWQWPSELLHDEPTLIALVTALITAIGAGFLVLRILHHLQ
ncbi:hypothetical protein R8Z50_22710 [Longispora sp. K20-0274]|uniref:hypothetical protein n=1 Tax=Longispora sp. K20-0274 TaxID=3088255 RepID=UPI003999E262